MFWLPLLISLAASPKDEGPQGVRVTTTQALERIALPPLKGSIEMKLDAMAARIDLRVPRDTAAVAARVSAHAGGLCPRVTVKGDVVEIRCRTRRIDALLSGTGNRRFVEIQELRGLPSRAGLDGPPQTHYEPYRTGLGSGCPGDSPAGVAECALRAGKRLEAALAFRDALESRHRQMAAVRLGDIALATGDPATAVGWYYRAGFLGVFGRVARARVCELDGDCLESTEAVKRAFDASGLPEPVRADMNLRAARAEAYQGRFDSAIDMLRDQIRRDGISSICRPDVEPICRRLILEALRVQMTVPATDPRREAPAEAPADTTDARRRAEFTIEVYLSLPNWHRGVLAIEMATAAAELAAYSGAPVFAGNLLSVVAPQLPDGEKANHLLRAAELYLRGNELARARVVVEYLSTRLPKQGAANPRWQKVQEQLTAMLAEEGQTEAAEVAKIDPEEVAKEIAAANVAVELSRHVTGRLGAASAKKQGEKQ